ncbi:MAG: signal peptidase I, partial [Bifidobacteriaceae bacterium]|nr:signal peptidase I [Bifidobacteriaceae bacterium]
MMAGKAKKGSFWGAFSRALSTGLLIGLVLLAGAVAVVPAVTGGKALTVLSGSMEPAFSPGDLIVVAGVKNAMDLKVGDIITYMPNPGESDLITHRIIGKGASGEGEIMFTTQGDDNPAPDEPVLAKQVRGKYLFHIPYLGYVSDWGSRHAAWAVTGFAVVLIAWGVWAFAFPLKRRKQDDEDTPGDDADRATSADPPRPAVQDPQAGQAVRPGAGASPPTPAEWTPSPTTPLSLGSDAPSGLVATTSPVGPASQAAITDWTRPANQTASPAHTPPTP